jgi:hypothetical protein
METEKILITIDDIIDDIKQSERDVPEEIGYTAQEMADMLGIVEKKMAKLLKKAVHSGKLKVRRVPIIDVSGRNNYSTVYFPNKGEV